MRRLPLLCTALLLLATACASSPTDTGVAQQPDATATAVPESTTAPTTGPTPLVVPTAQAVVTSTAVPTATVIATVQPTTAVPSATPQATATPRPIPTVAPTSIPPTPIPTTVVPTATAVPPTPTPTPGWVNPDCYVGPGAADEAVWWCGGRICVVGAPHYGCPTTPPTYPYLRVNCTISDTDIVVNEVIILKATHSPASLAVQFAFNHGDGTVDNTSESRAYYRQPGTYNVTLIYQYAGGKGTKPCGTVTVRPIGVPTPTPTPTGVNIGCSISPSRTVRVNETLTFTAFSNPSNLPAVYVFDHGDGTLDKTSQSKAYYAAPGFYDVRLNWAYNGRSGTTYCGTVTVEPVFNAGDYLGRTLGSAEALATSRGLSSRVVRVDDIYYPGTADYSLTRVNFEIDAQLITKAYLG